MAKLLGKLVYIWPTESAELDIQRSFCYIYQGAISFDRAITAQVEALRPYGDRRLACLCLSGVSLVPVA